MSTNIKLINFNNHNSNHKLEVSKMRRDEKKIKEEAEKVFKGIKLFITC